MRIRHLFYCWTTGQLEWSLYCGYLHRCGSISCFSVIDSSELSEWWAALGVSHPTKKHLVQSQAVANYTTIKGGTGHGIRTHTWTILSRLPLPLGYSGIENLVGLMRFELTLDSPSNCCLCQLGYRPTFNEKIREDGLYSIMYFMSSFKHCASLSWIFTIS